jgi:hypothetical protein
MLKDAKTIDGWNAYHIPSLSAARQSFEIYMNRRWDWSGKTEWTIPPYWND